MTELPPGFTLLQIVPALDTGGAEQSVVDAAGAVVRAGGRALVASSGGRMVERLEAVGGEHVRMAAESKSPVTIAANAFRLAGVVRREKAHLLHVHSRAPAFSALWAARMTGRPVVASYHGAYAAQGGIKRWYNAVMTRADLTLANSAFTRAHVLEEHDIPADRVVTVPLGVDFDRFDPAAVAPERIRALEATWGLSPNERRMRFLLAGRLARIKGHLTLFEAAWRLKAQGRSDMLLLFAGEGRDDYRDEVLAAFAGAGMSDTVRLVGRCEDMPAAYLAADAVAAPSLVPETFGLTTVEAQAMGRPVLASALGAMPETVEDGRTGWLIPAGDGKAWAEALARAADLSPQTLVAMGQAGRVRAQALFSKEAAERALFSAYRRALGMRR